MNKKRGTWGWAALDSRLGSESDLRYYVSDNKYQNLSHFTRFQQFFVELKMWYKSDCSSEDSYHDTYLSKHSEDEKKSMMKSHPH